ncbi:esterase/lipase family protein [Undibacterium sp. SXout20W]|uniref:esterase/lipase family protein n=1 Tax=Undibacterium sp. SXout20W TaxID=3413051 RepID=UPI003BF0EB3F
MTKQIVFVDGMGGKRYMRRTLKNFFTARGYAVHFFDYSTSKQSLADIKSQLTAFLLGIASQGKYCAIGYSFGGILLRLVLQEHENAMIFPSRLVLLASPIRSNRLSRRFKNWNIYKALTGDCGLIATDDRLMSTISIPSIPTACIYGVWPWLGVLGLFEGCKLQHDGMIAVDELLSPDFALTVEINASHAFIPGNSVALSHTLAWFENVWNV